MSLGAPAPVDVESLGAFDEPAHLPAPWGNTQYLLGHHGDSQIHGAWTVPGAFLALIEGSSRALGLLGLGAPDGVAQLLASPEVAAVIAPLESEHEGGDQVDAPVLDHTETEPPSDENSSTVRWITVPQGTVDRAPEVFAGALAHLGGRGEWEWMWIGEPLRDADPTGVERLEQGADIAAEVATFLAVAHPTSDTAPTDPRIFAWWAFREEGQIRAVVGALRFAPGLAPYLVALGVDPEHRGRGLAGAVLAAAVRDGLAEEPRVGRGVSLALYSDNERAKRVYVRHGFELHHAFESLRAPR